MAILSFTSHHNEFIINLSQHGEFIISSRHGEFITSSLAMVNLSLHWHSERKLILFDLPFKTFRNGR